MQLNSYKNLPSPALTLLALSLFQSFGSGMGVFIAIYLDLYFKFPVIIIGKILSCYGLGTIAGGLGGGYMADKISAVKINALGLMLFGIAFLCLAFSKDAFSFMFILFIMGAANSSFIASNSVLLLRTAKENSNLQLKLLSFKNVSTNLGAGLAAALLSLYGHHNFQSVFMAMAVLLFGAALMQWQQKNKFTAPFKTENVAHKPFRPDSLFYRNLICLFCAGFIISQSRVVYPVYINSLTDSASLKTLLFSLNPVLVIFFQSALCDYFQNHTPLKTMGTGALGLTAGMMLPIFNHSFGFLLTAVVFSTFGEMLFFTFSQLICWQSLDKSNKGKALGCWRTLFASSQIAGPYLSSLLYTDRGVESVWILCSILGILCFFLTHSKTITFWRTA